MGGESNALTAMGAQSCWWGDREGGKARCSQSWEILFMGDASACSATGEWGYRCSEGRHSHRGVRLRWREGAKWCAAMGELGYEALKGTHSHRRARLGAGGVVTGCRAMRQPGGQSWGGVPQPRGPVGPQAEGRGPAGEAGGPGGSRGGRRGTAGPGGGRGPLTCAAELQQPMASAGPCPDAAR